MAPCPQTGYFVIADLSGYTAFMAGNASVTPINIYHFWLFFCCSATNGAV